MSGSSGRRLGREAELAWAKKTEGERISEAGMPGADVQDQWGELWEVKRRKSMTKELWNFVAQARKQGGYKVALYSPRKEWLVIMPAKEYLKEREEWHDKTK